MTLLGFLSWRPNLEPQVWSGQFQPKFEHCQIQEALVFLLFITVVIDFLKLLLIFFHSLPQLPQRNGFDSLQTPIKFPTRDSLGSGWENLFLFPVRSSCLSLLPSREGARRIQGEESEELPISFSRWAENGQSGLSTVVWEFPPPTILITQS